MFRQAQKDLNIAEKEIERMASTTSFSEFEEAWQNCLGRIERSWESAERKLRDKKGYQQFIKPYKVLRKKDPLLVFLKQARNAETHAVSGTIDRSFRLAIQDKIGRPFHVEEIEVKFENGVLSLDLKTPDHFLTYDVKFLPDSPRLTKFKNYYVWYEPPKTHLGNLIRDAHPVVAAKYGLQFYRAFLGDAGKVYEGINA